MNRILFRSGISSINTILAAEFLDEGIVTIFYTGNDISLALLHHLKWDGNAPLIVDNWKDDTVLFFLLGEMTRSYSYTERGFTTQDPEYNGYYKNIRFNN
jgi:hypothetical protein